MLLGIVFLWSESVARRVSHWVAARGFEEIKNQAISAGLQAVIPFVVSALTLVSGVFGSTPLPYLIAAASVVFACVSAGLFYFNSLLYQKSAESKLRFGRLFVMASMGSRPDGSIFIRAVKIGIEFNSIAVFPMETHVDDIKTILDGRVNPNKRIGNTLLLIDANGEGRYWDDEVVLSQRQDFSNALIGEFEFTISYGKTERRKYHLRGKYRIYLKLKSEQEIEGFQWEVV